MIELEIDESGAEQRLDRWLRKTYPQLTQGMIEKFLRTGLVRVDGQRVKAAHRLVQGQKLRLPPFLASSDKTVGDAGGRAERAKGAPLKSSMLLDLKQRILFEDRDVIIFDKPAGFAVQGGSGIRESLDDLLPHFAHKRDEIPKLVHRLDRETSGVLVVARSALAARNLSASFRDHTAQKLYLALGMGMLKPPRGLMRDYLLRRGVKMALSSKEDGQRAETRYAMLDYVAQRFVARGEEEGLACLLALMPLSGRTHQLRVQCAQRDVPLLGDALYSLALQAEPLLAMGAAAGLHLHAARLLVPHPRDAKQMLDVSAALPAPFKQSLRALGLTLERDALTQVFTELREEAI